MRRMHGQWMALGLTIALAAPGMAGAQAPSGSQAPAVDATQAGLQRLDTVSVSGAQPGPPLWLVRKGTNELWILGAASPLPRGMTFASREVADVIARSQELILLPSISVGVDAGFFGKLALIPSALKARNNPDGKTLAEMLPPATHARWLRLKAQYIGRDSGIEKRRPVVAASELYSEAIDDAKLGGKPVIWPVIDPLATKAGLKRTTPQVKHTLKNAKAMLKQASKVSFQDEACFNAMLDTVEFGLPQMRARANAWATGDIERLRTLPLHDPMTPCWEAYMAGGLGEQTGMKDLPQRARAGWIAAAEAALAANRSTFALLPMGDLLDRSKVLAILEAKGYEVVEP